MIRKGTGLNRRGLVLASVLLAIVSMALLAPINVRASAMTLRAAQVTAAPGKTVDAAIDVSGAPDVGALQITLTYDAAVLTAEAVTAGPLLGSA